MAEYIEREALEVELNHRLNFLMGENGEYDHYTSGFDEAVTRVENFPAADVAPVVHCKDCKHYEIHKPKVLENCERNGYIIPMKPDDFCSYGERKDGDGNG